MDRKTALLLEHYPAGQCALNYRTPFELLVASRLSAQCTDVRVNIVTKELFEKYNTPEDFCKIPLENLENYIRSCGLFHTKAVDIKAMSQKIVDEFNAKVPDNMKDLLSLRGVGRKIANLILGEVYGEKGVIIADTHCIRLANRLGYVDSQNPVVVERELRKKIPADKSLIFCHALVAHGRQICKAQNPDCENCFIKRYCKYFKEIKK
ncbi:MAG: endonuclease III [Clostridiales bacterium]|nr:MAG: endonuclease III [Clostridiales bacterium]